MPESSTVKPFNGQSEFTIFNNYILDYVMPKTTPNGWKCLCFIIRKTKGWQKLSDDLSFSQIKKGTGIKSDPTVRDALKELEDSKFILVQRHDGQWDSNTYTLNTTLEIEVERQPTIESIATPTIENEVVPTIESIDTKETPKENKKKVDTRFIPAFKVYIDITKHYGITDHWRNRMNEVVGDSPDDLVFWGQVVEGHTGCGWFKGNVKLMLEYYQRHEIPGAYKNGASQNGHQTQKEGFEQARQAPVGNSPAALEHSNQQGAGLGRVSKGLGDALKARARTGGGST